jgi:HEAT repeat protein
LWLGLQNAAPEVRRLAVRGLEWAPQKVALKLVAKALSDPVGSVRCQAAHALILIGGSEACALAEKALAGEDGYAQLGATTAVYCLERERALDLYAQSLSATEPGVRMSAVAEMRTYWTDKRFAEALARRLVVEQDEEVRDSIVEAIRSIPGR